MVSEKAFIGREIKIIDFDLYRTYKAYDYDAMLTVYLDRINTPMTAIFTTQSAPDEVSRNMPLSQFMNSEIDTRVQYINLWVEEIKKIQD